MLKIFVIPQKLKQNKKNTYKILKIKTKLFFIFWARQGLYLAPTYFHLENQS